MLGDFGESGSGDTLEGKLGLLDAENEETNCASIDDRLGEVSVVLGDAGESKGSSFLDGWVELLEAVHEGIEGTRVYNGLGKMRRVLGNGSQDVGGGLLVESLKASTKRLVRDQ